ncbi:hypothetical protein HY374_01855 [Candidatus Berkelbacteria bacterium]|nr:hypothetical protein [Candidatus Berkelbacteria bacterium]
MSDTYLKLPVPGGKETFVRVDPSRLHPDAIRQFYRHDVAARGGNQYRPIFGMEHLVIDRLDTDRLRQLLDSIVADWQDELLATGPSGREVGDMLVMALAEHLAGLINCLATGSVASAEEPLQAMLYHLKGVSYQLVSQLDQVANQVSGLQAAVDTGGSNEILDDLYVAWDESTHRLNQARGQCKQLVERVETLGLRIGEEQADWRLRLSPANDEIRHILGSLNGKTGFITSMRDLLEDEELREHVVDLGEGVIEQTERAVARCRSIEAEARRLWQERRRDLGSEVAQLEVDVETALLGLETVARRFESYGRLLRNAQSPYERESVSKEEYDLALECIHEQLPKSLRRQLTGRLAAFKDQLEVLPQLSDEVQLCFADAVRQVDAVRAAIESETGRRIPSRPTQAPVDDEQQLATERVNQLYELVIGVAGVLTCTSQQFATSNFRALLEVVAELGLCEPDEVDPGARAITDLVDSLSRVRKGQVSEKVVHQEGERLVELWRTTKSRWIRCRQKKQWRIKLALGSLPRAERILQGLELTAERVREAHQALRARKSEEYRDRKRGASEEAK